MDWILSAAVILGNYLLGRKIRWGWAIMMAGACGWIFYALALDPPQYGLIPASVVNFFVAGNAFYTWSKR